jgi:Inner membrane protein YgaP-like, transmembrane domain
MSPNMSTLDRSLRAVIALAAIAAGVVIGAGSPLGIVLFAVAAVMVATSAIGFCPLYALLHFDSRGHRPLPH